MTIDITPDEWAKYYKTPRIITDDSKLINFQFKLNHRIIYTNTRLMQCGKKETELCTFCNSARETILHLFCECVHSKNLWNYILNLLYIHCNVYIQLYSTVLLFGVVESDRNKEINFILLLCRYFIYVCKLRETTPTVESFLSFLRYYRKIEEYGIYLYSQKKEK